MKNAASLLLIFFCGMLVLVSLVFYVHYWAELRLSRNGYEDLRALRQLFLSHDDLLSQTVELNLYREPLDEFEYIMEASDEGFFYNTADVGFEAIMTNINEDFIGWIVVGNTRVDYPVVQGDDNKKYINTTFTGENNSSGAIFMDYRLNSNFTSPVTILYGHNMRDGSMFGSLKFLLGMDFNENPTFIEVNTKCNKYIYYQVFLVKTVSAWDEIFSLTTDFNKSENILILSTCTTESDKRLLIIALQTHYFRIEGLDYEEN